MFEKSALQEERRKYIRLDLVMPVQFRLLSLDGKHFLSDWLQGFTNNINKGGICLNVNNLNPEHAKFLKEGQARLYLDIEMPVLKYPISAEARVSWMKDVFEEANRYFIGLSYERIDDKQNRQLMRYVRTKKYFFPAAVTLIFLLGASFLINGALSVKLLKANKTLVAQLVRILQESSVAKQKVKEISMEKQNLQLKIDALQERMKSAEEERKKLEEAKGEQAREIKALIDRLSKEKDDVQDQLNSLQHKESLITQDLLRLDKRKADLQRDNLDRMYQWLKIHQNPRTGLVMSFEGDSDINDWAFIYDQSLLIQAEIYFNDFIRAEKALDFFHKKAKRIDGLFMNAYYASDGRPAEYTVHSGPNIWLGIAAAQYTAKTKDKKYLNMAENIAKIIIYMQEHDKDGGIPGGPKIEWYSSEHNLDAYAFFNMLYKLTGKKVYLDSGEKTLAWLMKHTYDKVETPIKRGKGDSTIATDTYAWSIASIGPEKLSQIGMNPDRIIEFAEQNCQVSVKFQRPEGGVVEIKGFDFAAARNLARGGVVSSEWTAQMVMAYKIMADYYFKKELIAKARSYEKKADAFLAELSNMIISSPSPSGQGEGCLPYATEDFIDTGHGWMTPKGKTTCSVAGTVYTLFSYYKYNPLELKE